MQIFYSTDITGNTCRLDRNESKHCVKVLRLASGSPVKVVDGLGNLYHGIITRTDPAECEITITDVFRNYEPRGYRLHIAISPLKNAERFEWFVEKCVEIGIDELTPLICRNTEKPGIRADRINNIIISAMKQSVKAMRPALNNPANFGDFVSAGQPGIKMIPTCSNDKERLDISKVYTWGRDALILIGPEGDFIPEELEMAVENGYKPVTLGSSRLRTETAGIVACHSVYFMNLYSG